MVYTLIWRHKMFTTQVEPRAAGDWFHWPMSARGFARHIIFISFADKSAHEDSLSYWKISFDYLFIIHWDALLDMTVLFIVFFYGFTAYHRAFILVFWYRRTRQIDYIQNMSSFIICSWSDWNRKYLSVAMLRSRTNATRHVVHKVWSLSWPI